MDEKRLIGWLALRKARGIGEEGIRRLMLSFDSVHEILHATPGELSDRVGLSERLATAVKDQIRLRLGEEELRAAGKAGISILTLKDPDYPQPLAAINDPPPVLYIKGSIPSHDELALAIVGSRQASPYGRRIAERMAYELADHGFIIVSGLARGIDASAHAGALDGGGKTIAILGCGLDVPYPKEDLKLRERIARSGAVISEFPLGTPPLAANFPHRNRIISGISLGTLVVEAAQRSGSLITAQRALDQGREVFAIPGNIGTANSLGTNRLIKAGAKLIQHIDDILEELQPQLVGIRRTSNERNCVSLQPVERALYEMLSDEPRHIDELISESRLPSAQITGALLQLELKGNIKQLSGQLYVRR